MVSLPKLHVAVLMGGWASERPVSLMSGNGVADALESRGHRVTRIDMDRQVAQRLAEAAPDVVFNALHGVPGEDGTVQGLMDLMGLPYTHSGLQTSVIAIDKELTKHALVPHGIPMPGGRIVRSEELYRGDPLTRPYVLKPVNEGSSVGVAIVSADGNYGNPISRETKGPWQEFESLLAEPYIRGRELTAAVLGDRDQLAALEALVHPAVHHERTRFIVEHGDARALLFDIPLLFETGGDAAFDKVIVVSASPELQRERVLARPGMTVGKFDQILRRQVPDAEKRERADFVVDTSGTLEQTHAQVANILTCLGLPTGV